MKRKVIEYLPFMGIVLVVCTASWLAGRTFPGPITGRRFKRRNESA
ncbi:hypothetical protein ACFLIM_46005 [Nonomuraea sp. M3C6]|uniref:Uncharacterized protein n=1 Tax=Nonomuraea marmarensis TaxID=3351344 RepID=A0ABW7AVZ7_9ACTN